jgi:chromosome segregation ATPase
VPIGKDTNEKKRLQRQIENLQKAWDNLEEKKAKLLQDRTHETRRLEADQLSSDIEKIKEQQEKIDNDLSKLEVKLKKIEVEEQQTLEILSKRDAQKSRHQDIVEEANIGLSALADLMQKPEVRDEVVVFRTRFEIVTSQIGILMIYKAIHDRLQILENKSNSLVHHIKDFPGDSGVLFILEDFYTDFQQINGEIIKLAAQVSLNSNIWILMLNEAQENLIKAIESANQRQLDNVFHDIRRILGRLPSEINDQLKSVKLHLHLLDLAETTINIQNDITRFELDIKKVSQFTKGVESLNSLSQELNTLVEDHDQWQKMDNFLHMLKANLDDISKLWTFYKSQLEAIYGNNTERWANLLRKAAEKLDSAIIEENPEDIKLYLQLFHSRVTQHFNWVDVQLKNLCEELVKVGKPLDSILEMMT